MAGTPVRQAWSFGPESGVPSGVGPFAHVTTFGSLAFCAGQTPTDPLTGQLVDGDFAAQIEQVQRNLSGVLAQLGLTLDDALMVRVYLTDLDRLSEFNAAYTGWFRGPLPSRTTVEVSRLDLGASLEIDIVAGIPDGSGRA
jgi:2-iminobutanoate/2-iminopropanoate deaminase